MNVMLALLLHPYEVKTTTVPTVLRQCEQIDFNLHFFILFNLDEFSYNVLSQLSTDSNRSSYNLQEKLQA